MEHGVPEQHREEYAVYVGDELAAVHAEAVELGDVRHLRSRHVLHGQDAARRQLGVRVGHDHVGVRAHVVPYAAEVVELDRIVHLLPYGLDELREHRARRELEVGVDKAHRERQDPLQDCKVLLYLRVDARPLDLDDEPAAV